MLSSPRRGDWLGARHAALIHIVTMDVRTEIDIEDHADGAALVAQVNDGNLTVPTVLFRDGSALTNPSAAQVASRLA